MEININNAFTYAIKLPVGPCWNKYNKLTDSTIQFFHLIIQYFLCQPFFSTVFCISIALLIITAIFIALFTMIGVFLFVLIIFLLEGFVLIMFVGIAVILSLFIILGTIVLFEIKYWTINV